MQMKTSLLICFLIILLTACKKKDGVSAETISLLQNRWTLISSSVTYPTNATLNRTYIGVSTDYYLFDTNDSLTIHMAGQADLPATPVNATIKYSFANNNTLVYEIGSNVQVNIKTLTSNLLVLTNESDASFTNGSSTVIYKGTKTDSLMR
jgi:hypothetical protein